jgi:hypothetical protein
VFFTRPISGTVLVLSIAGLLWPLARKAWSRYRKASPDGRTQTP